MIALNRNNYSIKYVTRKTFKFINRKFVYINMNLRTRRKMNLFRQPICQLAMYQRTISAIAASDCGLPQPIFITTSVVRVTSTDIYCCKCRYCM